MIITSVQNPKVKEIVALRQSAVRRESGLTIVEGVREIHMAVLAGVRFEWAMVCPSFLNEEGQALMPKITSACPEVIEVDEKVFAKISFGDRQEGVIAVVASPRRTMRDFKFGQNPLIVVTEEVEKPGNLGAILRTCDAAGVDALLVCQPATDIYNPNVIRASLGTVFTVPVVPVSNQEAYDLLKSLACSIFVTLPEAKDDYTKANFGSATAIVMGSEQEGISAFWRNHATEKIRIPMGGKADSLNVSVSTAIVVYEALRQRAHSTS